MNKLVIVSIVLFLGFERFAYSQMSVSSDAPFLNLNPESPHSAEFVSSSFFGNGLFVQFSKDRFNQLDRFGESLQLSVQQFNNLQDERLKAAIIRSLHSNSSWQQR